MQIIAVNARPQKLRAQSHITAPTSDASQKQDILVTHISAWTTTNSEVSMPILHVSLNTLPEQLTEFRKVLYFYYSFIIKATIQEHPNGKNSQGRYGSKGVCGTSMPSPGMSTSQYVFTNSETLQTLSFRKFYDGVIKHD